MQIRVEVRHQKPLKAIADRENRSVAYKANEAIEAYLQQHRADCAAGKKMPRGKKQ